jgi:hypothetical protein
MNGAAPQIAAPQITLDRAIAAELARVLATIAEFLHARPAARASLARFTYPGCGDPSFWTDELLDYLAQTAADLHHLTQAPSTPADGPQEAS